MQVTRIKDMQSYKNEVFRDLNTLNSFFQSSENDDNAVAALVIIDTTVRSTQEVANENGTMESKEF